MSINRYMLIENAAATSAAKMVNFAGDHMFRAVGTFGGATVSLEQRAPDGTSWLAITDASLTAAGSFVVSLAAGVEVRAVVTGGAPSALYVSLDLVSVSP